MTALPAPMMPEGSELRSFEFFPLHHKRLSRSRWWRRASHEARSISVDLWCEAYEQCPVASLPNDDLELAAFAGFGRDVEGWMRVRDEVMEPWVLCSDDRFYHPTLAEVALEVWTAREERRRIEREKKARQRAKSPGEENAQPEGQPPSVPGDTPKIPPVFDHIGEDRRGEKEEPLCVDAQARAEPEEAFGDDDLFPEAKPAAEPPQSRKWPPSKRVPEKWNPTDADLAVGIEKGWSPEYLLECLANFRDHEFKETRTDWSACFRKWLRSPYNQPERFNDRQRPTAASGWRNDDQDRIRRMYDGALEAARDHRDR